MGVVGPLQPGDAGQPEPAAPHDPASSEPGASFYEAVGGEATFHRLVRSFYAGVESDPALRALYPEADLGPAEERLRLFLIQYWGGPGTYSALRGHPRLRMRHAPFAIDSAARDAWLLHMRRAVEQLELPEPHERTLWNYLRNAAESMRNTPG
jgi:hemoglobin